MKKIFVIFFNLFFLTACTTDKTQNSDSNRVDNTATQKRILPPCKGDDTKLWTMCTGVHTSERNERYSGEWLDGSPSGSGKITFRNRDHYIGRVANGRFEG